MEFKNVVVYTAERFAVGIETDSGKYFLSIPVSNQLVNYKEYYEISPEQFALFRVDQNTAVTFVQQCRARQLDALLIVKPGRDRGVPM